MKLRPLFSKPFFIKGLTPPPFSTLVKAKSSNQENLEDLLYNLSDSEREKVEQYINSINLDLGDSTPVSVDDWCEKSKIPVQSVVKLLNKNNLPVLRLGKFRGAYPEHISRVLEQEFKRQFKIKTEKKAVNAARRTNKP